MRLDFFGLLWARLICLFLVLVVSNLKWHKQHNELHSSVETRPSFMLLTQCYRWDTCRCWKNRRSQSSASTVGRPLRELPNGRFDGWREQTAIFLTEFWRQTRCRCVRSPCAGPLLTPSWLCCSTRWHLFRCCEGRTVCPTEWSHRRSRFCQRFYNKIFKMTMIIIYKWFVSGIITVFV